jgi:hypothetical protein
MQIYYKKVKILRFNHNKIKRVIIVYQNQRPQSLTWTFIVFSADLSQQLQSIAATLHFIKPLLLKEMKVAMSMNYHFSVLFF